MAEYQGISANSNEHDRRYNFQGFTNISGNFRKIYNPSYICCGSTTNTYVFLLFYMTVCMVPLMQSSILMMIIMCCAAWETNDQSSVCRGAVCSNTMDILLCLRAWLVSYCSLYCLNVTVVVFPHCCHGDWCVLYTTTISQYTVCCWLQKQASRGLWVGMRAFKRLNV